MFDEFIGSNIKASVRDGDKVMMIKGVYELREGNFIKVSGKLGTIYVNTQDIIKIALWGGDDGTFKN